MKAYIGVDISKLKLDVNWQGKIKNFDNNKKGIIKLINRLKTLHKNKQLALVIVEASGGYEKPLVNLCHHVGLPIHVAHANKVRAFVRSKGLLAKTDHLDAKILSEYGALMDIQPDRLLLNKREAKIKILLKRREQLIEEKKCETNRMDKLDAKIIKNSVMSHVKWLKN